MSPATPPVINGVLTPYGSQCFFLQKGGVPTPPTGECHLFAKETFHCTSQLVEATEAILVNFGEDFCRKNKSRKEIFGRRPEGTMVPWLLPEPLKPTIFKWMEVC